MRKFVAKIQLLAIATICLVLAAGCGEKEQKEEVLKLGYGGALSGEVASYGIPSKRATELVVEKINAKGGVLGKKVVLIAEDDQCKPEIATNTATRLATQEVAAVVGHICSGATMSALAVYNATGMVSVSPSATAPELTQSGDYPNFFRTISSDDAQAKIQADFITKNLGLQKVAVLHDRADYGRGLAEFVRKFIEESGTDTKVVLFEGITAGAVDYSAVIQKIKTYGAEVVVFGGYHPEASKIVTQMRNNGIEAVFMSADGVKDDAFIRITGEFAEGVYATGPIDISQNPMAKEAIEEHRAAYKEEPGAFYINAYSAALALLNAIEKAGSTDSKAIADALRREYMETPLGKIRFDEKGDAIGIGFAMYQVKDGAFMEVK